jgi:Tol biopolymer transport system component
VATADAFVPQQGGQPPSTKLDALHDDREKHLKNVKQLTFGGQNAECYWSFDGKKLIFQSTRDSLKCDQQFTMNPDGSDVKMVSTGKGRTTCGYFMPGNKDIVYASTHAWHADCPPEPDRSKGYVWAITPGYVIYKAKADGSNPKPFFPKSVIPGADTGYNAEATIAPNGKKIVFTSTMDGDLELYTINPDGSGLKRITHTVGYDGGAFFSPDSKLLVWRAGRPSNDAEKAEYQDLLKQNLVRPSRMELMVGNADGSNVRQITNNGKANFAPFFTPDGKKLVFASNQGDPRGRKFEIYMINVDGTGLEQVTWGGEFDSFPMLSPDGKKIVWASNRNGKVPHETNVFIADWVP